MLNESSISNVCAPSCANLVLRSIADPVLLNAKIFAHYDDVNVAAPVRHIATYDYSIVTNTEGLTTVSTFPRRDAWKLFTSRHLVFK